MAASQVVRQNLFNGLNEWFIPNDSASYETSAWW